MLKRVEVAAPGKINLALEVTGKREDGYHLLDTVMQSISLYDRVRLVRTDGAVRVVCTGAGGPQGEENLCYHAIRRFCEQAGVPFFGISAEIDKVIPMQAGLGGGSADAAAALIGMDALFETGFPRETLRDMGLVLGADVPFMLDGGTMRARGIGEELERLPALPEFWIVVVKPDFGMSTVQTFQRFDTCTGIPQPDIEALVAAIENGDLPGIGALLCNQLEAVALGDAIPEIKKKLLGYGALGASMTGSGSAVFALYDELLPAKEALGSMERGRGQVYLAKPVQTGCRITARQGE